jgi:hypothetical protein
MRVLRAATIGWITRGRDGAMGSARARRQVVACRGRLDCGRPGWCWATVVDRPDQLAGPGGQGWYAGLHNFGDFRRCCAACASRVE